jgi:methyl-accepting chemotaxis protein
MISFGLLLILLIAVISTAYSSVSSLRKSQQAMYDDGIVTSVSLERLMADMNIMRVEMAMTLLINNQDDMTNRSVQINDAYQDITTLIPVIQTNIQDIPGESAQFQDAVSRIASYRATMQDQTIPLLTAGRLDEATKVFTGIQNDNYQAIQDDVIKITDHEGPRANLALAQSQKTSMYDFWLFGIMGGIALLLACFMIIYLNRIIANPLRNMAAIAQEIADGDISAAYNIGMRNDEIGMLAQAFSKMSAYLVLKADIAQHISDGDFSDTMIPKSEKDRMGNAIQAMLNYLKEVATTAQHISDGDFSDTMTPKSEKDRMGNAIQAMLNNLKQVANTAKKIATGNLAVVVSVKSEKDILGTALSTMVEGLREITRENIEGVNVIASATGEIMASTAQLTAAVVATAASITETTSSAEEVKQTAQFTAEKTRLVGDMVQKHIQFADNGRKAVGKMIEVMANIQEQVESIVQSLVHFSEQSQAISEIIASVNDLAEQSNLLAVNAAIEAAKAGEQGKGFAVVAQEVKILAERSKEATAQVRTILNDTLKANNSAIIATEQGTKAVEAGITQTRDAGESIRQMAESAESVAQSVIQVSASTQQQLIGMDQITTAMEDIRMASDQNVIGLRQVELTAQSLHDLGQMLKQAAAKYVL